MPKPTLNAVSYRSRKYGFGCLPDAPDHRDSPFRMSPRMAAVRSAGMQLDHAIDLRTSKSITPVRDQGPLGSCGGFASTTLFWHVHRKMRLPLDAEPSALYVYNKARMNVSMLNIDSGMQLRDAMKILATLGVCPTGRFPYAEKNWFAVPPKGADRAAKKHKAVWYFKLDTDDERMWCLAWEYPFICGVRVFDSMFTETVRTTGVVTMPQPGENVLGGHALCIVGYNRDTKMWLAQNSWGTKFGDKGFLYLPFEYVSKYGFTFWTIQVES